MGTNYYIHSNECHHCGRHDEIHLGKSSYGWQFSFQYNGGQYYKNIKEMKEWMKNKKIFDEYGEEISYDVFWKMVKSKQKKGNINHAKYSNEKYGYSEKEKIIDGYSFSDCQFC